MRFSGVRRLRVTRSFKLMRRNELDSLRDIGLPPCLKVGRVFIGRLHNRDGGHNRYLDDIRQRQA
jgi:hypothetical protein